MFERILVALDNPENNEPLITAAIGLAKTTNARLLLLHVLPLENQSQAQVNDIDHARKNHLEWQRCQTSDLEDLRSLYKAANAAGVSADIAQPLGDPGQKICELAHQWGADLIVMGRRDTIVHRYLKLIDTQQTTLGRVSRYVAANSACSTVILKSPFSEDADTHASTMTFATSSAT
jgi:nucleotide-binding universal stress UspA family protein